VVSFTPVSPPRPYTPPSDKVVLKIEINFAFNKYFSSKIVLFMRQWGEYCTAGPAIVGNIIRRLRISSSIPKATNTHSDYVILNDFSHSNNCCKETPQYHIVSTPSAVFQSTSNKINLQNLYRVFRCLIFDKHHIEIR